MNRIILLLSSTAQAAWVVLRPAGCAVLGKERFERLLKASGLREWKARHFQFTAVLPDGNKIVYRPHDQCFIDEVYNDRVYDAEGLIKPGQTVVDIGGHIGLFSLYSSSKVGKSGRVVVCEPGPNNFPILERNLSLNELPQITARPYAISDHEGEAEFFIPIGGTEADNPATNSLYPTSDRKAVKVKLKTLDALVKEEGIGDIDHLKVDVEGAELDVLAGGEAALKRTRRVMMEVHPGRVDPKKVTAWLEARGFKMKELSADPLVVEGRRS
jgi:FkbM family methyltransferase